MKYSILILFLMGFVSVSNNTHSGNTLYPGQLLERGERIYSPSGEYYVTISKGNWKLEVRETYTGNVLYSYGNQIYDAFVTNDGHFYFRDHNQQADVDIHCGKYGNCRNCKIEMQDNGAFTMYCNGIGIWSTLTDYQNGYPIDYCENCDCGGHGQPPCH
ncbi:MAG: hypothetical protein AAF502_23660 [Bacteroidota bacterium]